MINTMKSPTLSPSPQLDSQTDMLLRLLAQVILADGHILSSELEALARGVNQLDLTDQFATPLSDIDIRNWFENYKLALNAETSPLRKDVALTYLILKLADYPNKKAVIDVLTEISLADANFHIEEKTLISIVKAFWQFEGLDAPNAKIET
jgi:uncharacterized tellurite resistance protein B-like protein